MKKDYAISHNYINILLILDDNIMKHREECDIHIYMNSHINILFNDKV